MTKAKLNTESHLRSILKGISWRIIAFADTFIVTLIITWLLTGTPEVKAGFTIAGIEFFLKLAIYYGHERIWQYFHQNKEISTLDTLYKSISWRVFATATTFLIAGSVLEEGFTGVALYLAITETVTKFGLYFIHERLWLRFPLGSIRKLIGK